jgi:protein involved in polysaccharide export with SLBB domain
MRWITAAVLAVGALLSSLGSYGDEALTLRPGDIIQLSLPGEPAFSDPFTVERDGNLLLPELGR